MKAYGDTSIEDPNMRNAGMALTKINIDQVDAMRQASQNPWLNAMEGVGRVGIGIGSSMLGSAVGPLGQQLGDATSQGLIQYGKKGTTFALGGKVPVEVEDNETAETPQGELLEFNGATHEEGGIDVNLPAGTDIYSDRIAVDGKTMSERKKDREKRLAKMSKLLESKKGDYLLKNSFKRTSELNDLEEEQDKKIQESIRAIKEGKPLQENEEAAYGGKLIAGNGLSNIGYNLNYPDEILDMQNVVGSTNFDGKVDIGHYVNGKFVKPNPLSFIPQKWDSTQKKYVNNLEPNLTEIDEIQLEPEKTNYTNTVINPNAHKISTEPDEESTFGDLLKSNTKNGIGDSLGLAGELIQGFGPLWNTMNNRAGDTPNVNMFRDFGKDALKTNDDNLALIEQETALNKADLQLARNSEQKRLRNSARSVNTLRALDLTTDQSSNRELTNIYANKIKATTNNNNVKSQLENTRDQVVMQGEQNRDLADRQDRDNYYTQHASDLNQLGMHIAGIGKNFNTARDNSEAVDLVNTLSKYGLTVEDLRKAKSKVKKKK